LVEVTMKFRAILLAVALAACGQSASGPEAPSVSDTPNAVDLNIEVGRAGAMLNSVESLTSERPGADPDVTDEADLARRLRETVWEYNVQRSRLCAKGLFAEVSCGPSFAPVWLSEPADAAPTLEDIQIRTVAVHQEVQRLWAAVCDDARSRVEDEAEKMAVCPME
jgi:hypothetical protein